MSKLHGKDKPFKTLKELIDFLNDVKVTMDVLEDVVRESMRHQLHLQHRIVKLEKKEGGG